jgi:hypothetical protein
MSDANDNPAVLSTPRFGPFWPLCVMAVSLSIFFGWQLTGAVQQRVLLVRLADQHAILSNRAAQAESELQSLSMDLLTLSRTDAEAKSICEKYRITFTPPAEASSVTQRPNVPAPESPVQAAPQPESAIPAEGD